MPDQPGAKVAISTAGIKHIADVWLSGETFNKPRGDVVIGPGFFGRGVLVLADITHAA